MTAYDSALLHKEGCKHGTARHVKASILPENTSGGIMSREACSPEHGLLQHLHGALYWLAVCLICSRLYLLHQPLY